jgi:hypothetical protein
MRRLDRRKEVKKMEKRRSENKNWFSLELVVG